MTGRRGRRPLRKGGENMNAPCYQCEERHYKCHGQCERYAAYRRIRDRMIEENRQNVAVNDHIDRSIMNATHGKKGLASI